MLWRQVRPRLLWDVRQFAQVTNSRTSAGHLSGSNPVQVPEGVTDAIFHYTPVLLDRNLSGLRVYGSLGATHFAGAGITAETLFFSAITLSIARLKGHALNTTNAVRKAGAPLPPWLLLEYTTAVPFVNAGECHFILWVTWLGPPIVGVS